MAKKSRNTARNDIDFFDPRYLWELVGTLLLVLIGCSAIVVSGFAAPAQALQIGAAFGLAVTAINYSVALSSGAHINPAVTIAMLAAGRMRVGDAVMYIIAQLIGGIAGAALLWLMLMGKVSPTATIANLGQNGYGPGFLGGYTLAAAIGVEFVATFILTLVILTVAAFRSAAVVAGLIVGLTLLGLHLAFINVTGLSVNPARSLGPALLVGGNALNQVWVFLLVPSVAGAVAGFMFRQKAFC